MALMLQLTSSKRKRVLSLTSLIDVIFLLLLFFMLSSTFSRYTDIELTSSMSGNTATSTESPVLLRLTQDALKINGKSTSLSNLSADIAPFAPNNIGSNTDNNTKRMAVISLGPQVSAQQLVDLMLAMRQQTQFTLTVLE